MVKLFNGYKSLMLEVWSCVIFTVVPVGKVTRHVRCTVSLFDSIKQLKGITSPGHSMSDLEAILSREVIVAFAEVKVSSLSSVLVIVPCLLPTTNVQMCCSGDGIHIEELEQVDCILAEGLNPSLHPYSTVAPSLVCEK